MCTPPRLSGAACNQAGCPCLPAGTTLTARTRLLPSDLWQPTATALQAVRRLTCSVCHAAVKFTKQGEILLEVWCQPAEEAAAQQHTCESNEQQGSGRPDAQSLSAEVLPADTSGENHCSSSCSPFVGCQSCHFSAAVHLSALHASAVRTGKEHCCWLAERWQQADCPSAPVLARLAPSFMLWQLTLLPARCCPLTRQQYPAVPRHSARLLHNLLHEPGSRLLDRRCTLQAQASLC